MTRPPRRVLAMLAATMVVAAACGSTSADPTGSAEVEADGAALTATVPDPAPSTSTADTSTPDVDGPGPATLPAACTLLTEADATAAFGEQAIAGDQRTDECWWSSAGDLKTVNLIRRIDDVATWRSGYQSDYWVPNALGDEGYTGTALDSVVWRVGDVQYELNVVYSTSGDPRQVATDLAGEVAARL